jgi:hypothetical protein
MQCDHLKQQNTSYCVHFRHACGYAGHAAVAGAIFAFHALVPDCCPYTGSTIIAQLHAELKPTWRWSDQTPASPELAQKPQRQPDLF